MTHGAVACNDAEVSNAAVAVRIGHAGGLLLIAVAGLGAIAGDAAADPVGRPSGAVTATTIAPIAAPTRVGFTGAAPTSVPDRVPSTAADGTGASTNAPTTAPSAVAPNVSTSTAADNPGQKHLQWIIWALIALGVLVAMFAAAVWRRTRPERMQTVPEPQGEPVVPTPRAPVVAASPEPVVATPPTPVGATRIPPVEASGMDALRAIPLWADPESQPKEPHV